MTTTESNEWALSDGERRLNFRGRMLASVTSNDGTPEKQQWYTDLDLYQTTKGAFVAVRSTVRHGDRRTTWLVSRSETEVQEWLGYGALSLELYEDAGWSI
jgi:hypothetical protein